MNTMALLAEYLKAIDQHSGPNSAEVIKLIDDNKGNIRFTRLANTASILWKMRCHSVHTQEKPTMEISALLGQYANLLKTFGGPDSAEAKQFFEEHKKNKKFAEIAKLGASMWMWAVR